MVCPYLKIYKSTDKLSLRTDASCTLPFDSKKCPLHKEANLHSRECYDVGVNTTEEAV